MTFTTLTFALFLALVFALYWGLKKRRPQNVLLLIASYIFYASWDYRFCALLLATSLVDYFVGRGLDKASGQRARRALLCTSLVWNLGLLGFFKYSNFFLDNFRLFSASIGWNAQTPALDILLPVGISFYTFKTLSYTIDVYKRRMKATQSLVDYMSFVAFFPQLLAGPIDRAHHLLPQFERERVFDYRMASDGCRLILLGLFKKMVLADNLKLMVDVAYRVPENSPGPQLIFAAVCFAFQIYYDFSAYSDIARGAAKLLGFDSMLNFNYPYFSQSPAEFWRRWHISLTTWFRDYVYFPLGGVRGSWSRRGANLLLTFILSGLWHGASWNFLIWGGLNGAALLPELYGKKRRQRGDGKRSISTSLKSGFFMLSTFVFITLTWVFFRITNVSQAFFVLKKMFLDASSFAAYSGIVGLLAITHIGPKLALFWLLFILAEWLQRHREHPLVLDRWPRMLRWTVYTILILITLRYGMGGGGQFIYFKF